jgi:hypothetical protein
MRRQIRRSRSRRPLVVAAVVGAALATMIAGDADAGDLIAHHLIAQRASRQFVADNPNPLNDGHGFPAEGDCGTWAEMPDNWKPVWRNPDGKQSEFAMFTAVGTRDLVEHIERTLGPIDNRLTGNLPNAGLAGNWYHFRDNGFGLWTAGGAAPDAAARIRGNAEAFLKTHAVGGNCSITPKGETWDVATEYWRRVLASTHLDPGDGYCHQHAGGNRMCNPGRDAGAIAIERADGTFDTTNCAGFIAQKWKDIFTRKIKCDEQVVVEKGFTVPAIRLGGGATIKPIRLSHPFPSVAAGTMRGAEVAAPGARAGVERVIGHHCQQFNPNLACAGANLNDPNYCECEIFGGNNPNGVTAVTNAADGFYVLSDNNPVNLDFEPQVKRTYAKLQAAVDTYNQICTKKDPKVCGGDGDCNDFCAPIDNDPSVSISAFCQ